MSNVLNYEQFVLTIQNDGDWYNAVTSTDCNNFSKFIARTLPFIEKICREQKITKRETYDRGYIYARLWDELGDSIPARYDLMAELVDTLPYSKDFMQGIRDHLKERNPVKPSLPANLTDGYISLIAKVRVLAGNELADYMWHSAPKLDTFDWDTEFLEEAFKWSDTPQGHDFWQAIETRLKHPATSVLTDECIALVHQNMQIRENATRLNQQADSLINELAASTQPKETIMKTETINIKSITYLNGVDVNTLSADELIDAVSQCEQQIEELGKIKAKSAAITAKVKRIKGVIAQLVKLLDGDTPVVAAAADKPE